MCVTLVDRKKEGLIPLIERKAGVTLTRIGTPQPSDLARVAGRHGLSVPLLAWSTVRGQAYA